MILLQNTYMYLFHFLKTQVPTNALDPHSLPGRSIPIVGAYSVHTSTPGAVQWIYAHVDPVNRDFRPFPHAQRGQFETLPLEPAGTRREHRTGAKRIAGLTYTSLYQGFLAAERHKTNPPGASTLRNSAISSLTSSAPGLNQSR